MNKVYLYGRTTAKPELKTTPSGQSVSSFSLATSRKWKDKQGQKQEQTEFHRLVAWGKTAEIAAQFVEKGQMLLVEGRLTTRQWEDKAGTKHSTTEIVVENFEFGEKARGAKVSAPDEPIDEKAEEVSVEDLPF